MRIAAVDLCVQMNAEKNLGGNTMKVIVVGCTCRNISSEDNNFEGESGTEVTVYENDNVPCRHGICALRRRVVKDPELFYSNPENLLRWAQT